MKILSGAAAGMEALTAGFNNGFRDYKYGMVFTPEQMERYLAHSAMDPADCAVLIDEEGTGQGVALLAVHGDSAWCGGLAVAPGLRRRGWARSLMHAVHRCAAERRVRQIQLEVLVANRAAQQLYANLGYHKKRQLLIWDGVAKPTPSESADLSLRTADAGRIIPEMHSWHSERPYWGRTAPILSRQREGVSAYVAEVAKDGRRRPLAFLLCRPHGSGSSEREAASKRLRIVDMAAHPGLPDAQAVMRATLTALQALHPGACLSVLNEPADSPWNEALAASGLQCIERQHEMRLRLA
jgi:GNAT superfamily N-acetyltransferase